MRIVGEGSRSWRRSARRWPRRRRRRTRPPSLPDPNTAPPAGDEAGPVLTLPGCRRGPASPSPRCHLRRRGDRAAVAAIPQRTSPPFERRSQALVRCRVPRAPRARERCDQTERTRGGLFASINSPNAKCPVKCGSCTRAPMRSLGQSARCISGSGSCASRSRRSRRARVRATRSRVTHVVRLEARLHTQPWPPCPPSPPSASVPPLPPRASRAPDA